MTKKKHSIVHTHRAKHAGKTYEQHWKIATAVFAILFLISAYLALTRSGAEGTCAGAKGVVSLDAATNKALDVVNTNLLQPGTTATLNSKSAESGVYKMSISVAGQTIDSYVTTDGKFFFPSALELDNPPAPQPSPSAPTGEPVEITLSGDEHSEGDADAPVTIVEWSDFQCPFCGRYVKETYPKIVKNYIDTGKVKYVFKQFPLGFHANAQKAAEASECAGEQGKFWELHDWMYANQGSLAVSKLKDEAEKLGLDADQFNNCLDSGKYVDKVKADIAEGAGYGITGTPGFFINGQKLSGAQPFSAFKAAIDAALKE